MVYLPSYEYNKKQKQKQKTPELMPGHEFEVLAALWLLSSAARVIYLNITSLSYYSYIYGSNESLTEHFKN